MLCVFMICLHSGGISPLDCQLSHVFMCCCVHACVRACVCVRGQVEKPAAGLKGKQEHRFAELDCVRVATPQTRCGISAPV